MASQELDVIVISVLYAFDDDDASNVRNASFCNKISGVIKWFEIVYGNIVD